MHLRGDTMNRDEGNNLHYTDWNDIQSAELLDELQCGVQVRSTKSRQRTKFVNIESMELIDDDFRNDLIQYADTRISKWSITMCKSPKSLYKLLRSVGLSPYYIHRVGIENETFGELRIEHADPSLSIAKYGEWRTMWCDEIKCLNGYDAAQLTHIDRNCIMTHAMFSNMENVRNADCLI